MKDIKIESIKKTKSLYDLSIRIDDEFQNYRISEDLLIESKFLSCKKLTEEEFKTFLSKLPFDSLLIDSLNYLDKRMKSEKEMRERLQEKTTSTELIEKTIESLKRKRLLNDEFYKNSVLNELIYVKRLGPLMVLNELSMRGLDGTFEYPIEIKAENIRKHLESFNKKCTNESRMKKVLKAKAYLLRKGYTESDIGTFFDYSLIDSQNEENLYQKELDRLKKKYDDPKRIKLELLKKGFKVKD